MKTLSNSWESRQLRGERTHDVVAAALQSRPKAHTRCTGLSGSSPSHSPRKTAVILSNVVPNRRFRNSLCRRFCAGGCVFSLLHNQEPWPQA